jgi:hypothetical protein
MFLSHISRNFALGNGISGSIGHCAPDTTSVEEHILETSSVDTPCAVRHKYAVGDEVSVEGGIGERAPRTTMFPAFVEELLPGGGYSVRHVLSNKSRRTWTKIEDGCRVQAPLVFFSPRESIEDRSHKHFQLAVAEARGEVSGGRTGDAA